MQEEKQRVIQEYVPGKQVTLAHVIANPLRVVCEQLGLDEDCDSIGILTITPGEAVIIAADVATKSANVSIGFLDRFGGSLVVTGDVSSVETAVEEVCTLFDKTLKFAIASTTRS